MCAGYEPGRTVAHRTPSGMSLARFRTARSWSCLIAPSVRPRTFAVSAIVFSLRNRITRQVCCSSGAAHRLEQDLVRQTGDHLVLRPVRGVVVAAEVVDAGLQPGPARLVVVDDQVARDRHEPGAEVLALPLELRHRPQCPEERLTGEVFGEGGGADPVEDEAVDRLGVVVVELTERLRVTVSRQVDEGRDPQALVVDLRGVAPAGPAGSVGVVAAVENRRSPDEP